MSLVTSSPTNQVADDEAASGAPERFAFRQRANVAQAFGHDAQAWAKYQCQADWAKAQAASKVCHLFRHA
jgi:hypothetical protein